jgi:polyvinyl alcohol dehydrogenase (cytochrome)
LKEQDYFAPSNWVFLNAHDSDVGSTGPTLMNNSALVFQIGKAGIGFLLNKNHLGGIGGQAFSMQACPSGSGVFAGTAFLNSFLYVPCTSGIVALQVNFLVPSFSVLWNGPAFHAGPPIISGGALWTVDTTNAVLHALNLTNGNSLYSFNLGAVAHFTTPSASTGRIFVAANNTIDAFNA